LRHVALLLGIILAAAVPSSAAGSAHAVSRPRIVTVVKVLGIGWFERMQQGIDRFAATSGVDATMTGARDASPASQIRILRRVLAERPRPDAITIVPNAPASLEPVLAKAREDGVKVVTHEASNQVNTDVDIEAFDNGAYGSQLMDALAACMGHRGTYVAFVGHTSAQSHMEWVRAAFRRAKQRYPKITRLGGPVESLEHEGTAYRKAKALLRAHPQIRGFEGSSTVDVAGIGRAIREAGRQSTTCVMGTSTPSLSGRYLGDGSVDRIFLWDPATAGEAQDRLALRLVRGEPIHQGLDLGLPGYHDLKRVRGTPHAFAGTALIAVDRSNVKRYPF
jgi:simple sugar transport system substrate-binding protein